MHKTFSDRGSTSIGSSCFFLQGTEDRKYSFYSIIAWFLFAKKVWFENSEKWDISLHMAVFIYTPYIEGLVGLCCGPR